MSDEERTTGLAGSGGEERRGVEEALEDLEGIVDRLEREELELDEALSLFETGIARLRTAGRLLDAARGRVEELVEEASGDLARVGFELPEDES